MKRLTLIAVIMIAAGFAFYFTSCKKDVTYSCDEGLHNYAKNTMVAHQSISRNELAKMGLDSQFAVFNSLSSTNKARIFDEKFQELLNEDSLSVLDKAHITKLKNYMSANIYDLDDSKPDAFLVSWQSEGFNNLGWDSLKMYQIAETWLTFREIRGFVNMQQAPTENACVCNSRFACSMGFQDCATGGCSTTKDGCGIVGSNPCKGTCGSSSYSNQ